NGVYVNGQKIAEAGLHGGDQIKNGQTGFFFYVADEPARADGVLNYCLGALNERDRRPPTSRSEPGETHAGCARRPLIERYADGAVDMDAAAAAQRHLERCEPCRSVFRALTADRFPRLRSYTILEKVGQGGFGVVYAAIHHDKQRIEAVKVLFDAS